MRIYQNSMRLYVLLFRWKQNCFRKNPLSNITCKSIIVSTHSMGEELYTKIFSFQSNLADRYNHCTGLLAASFEKLSSVKYVPKKFLWTLFVSAEISRFQFLWTIDWFSLLLFTFSLFLYNFLSSIFKRVY